MKAIKFKNFFNRLAETNDLEQALAIINLSQTQYKYYLQTSPDFVNGIKEAHDRFVSKIEARFSGVALGQVTCTKPSFAAMFQILKAYRTEYNNRLDPPDFDKPKQTINWGYTEGQVEHKDK